MSKQQRKKPQGNVHKLWQWMKSHPVQTVLITILILVSFSIRLQLALETPLNPGNTDPRHYHGDVMKIFEGEKITSVYWPWGYPYFLIPFYAIFGQTFVTAKILNVILSTLNVGLVYLLGRKLFNHKVGVVAGILMLFDPLMTFYSHHVYTEPLFIALTLGAMLISMKEQFAWWKIAIAGVLIGYGAMIKPWVIILIPIIFTWWLLQNRGLRSASIGALMLIAGFILIITPWTINNYNNHERFIPLPTNGPTNFYLGNHEYGTLAFVSNWPEETWEPLNQGESIDTPKYAREAALEYVFQDIPGFIGRTWMRFWTYWSHPNTEWYQRYVPHMGATMVYLWTVWVLAVVGIIFSLKHWKQHSMNYLFLLLMTAVFSLTIYLARFKIPTMPFQHIYAAAAIILLINIGKQVVKNT